MISAQSRVENLSCLRARTRFHFFLFLHNEETLLSLSLCVLLALCWRIGGYSRNDGLERWKLVNEKQQGTYIGT